MQRTLLKNFCQFAAKPRFVSPSSSSSSFLAMNGRSYGSIKDAGGVFGAKASVEEEKFMHDHEMQVLKDYKKSHPTPVISKDAEPAAAVAATDAEAGIPTSPLSKGSKNHNNSRVDDKEKNIEYIASANTGGVLGGREAAQETLWIRKHDRELVEKLREQQDQKKK